MGVQGTKTAPAVVEVRAVGTVRGQGSVDGNNHISNRDFTQAFQNEKFLNDSSVLTDESKRVGGGLLLCGAFGIADGSSCNSTLFWILKFRGWETKEVAWV